MGTVVTNLLSTDFFSSLIVLGLSFVLLVDNLFVVDKVEDTALLEGALVAVAFEAPTEYLLVDVVVDETFDAEVLVVGTLLAKVLEPAKATLQVVD